MTGTPGTERTGDGGAARGPRGDSSRTLGDEPLVRRAVPADLDTVVALRLALLREYPEHPIYGQLRPDAERRARALFAAQLEAANEAIFIAELGHVAVGLLRCVEMASSPLLLPERYCYVSSAYVRPEYRRRGVLHALLARARDWCMRRGLREMRLHNVGARHSAAAAWEALGFEVVEQVRVLRVAATAERTSSVVTAPEVSPRAR